MKLSDFQGSHKGAESAQKARKAGKGSFSAEEIAALFEAAKGSLGPWAAAWDLMRAWIEDIGAREILGLERIPSKEAWDQISSSHHAWKLHDSKRAENAFPEAFSRQGWKAALMHFSREAWAALSDS